MRVLMTAVGGGHHVGLGVHGVVANGNAGVKVAFCFPGQGSQDVGMGRAMAEAFPEARAVYDEASDAVGFDVAKLCFEGPLEELTDRAAAARARRDRARVPARASRRSASRPTS